MGEEPSAAAIAALDFVQNENHAGFLGDLTQVSHELIVRNDNTAHTLYAFDDHCRHISLGEFRLHRLDVVQRQEGDVVVRVERGGIFRIVGDGHGSGRPSVKGSFERDHPVLSGVERCQFEGVLVGLRSRVDQEERVVLKAGEFADFPCQLDLKRILHAVGVEADLVQLVGDGRHIFRMAVADRDDGVASVEVKVLLPLVIPDSGAFGFDGGHVKKAVNVK